MIVLEDDQLVFRFPEVHEDARCTVGFQRTLRIPDDDQDYLLPPGLGRFPLRHLDDFADRVPGNWQPRGGVVMPMHQSEAMWIRLGGSGYPFALKIATGKINAITGEAWINHLNRDPQDYVVIPKQPWLDGYCVEKGVIRQFVAMPLGQGFSVEEQITGEAEHGGLQIVAYPMKAEVAEKLRRPSTVLRLPSGLSETKTMFRKVSDADMGLAPGGRMIQDIHDDPYGMAAWDLRHSARCFVTIANTEAWQEISGEAPPTQPPSAKSYNDAGLPWFEHYDADPKPVRGSDRLAGLKSWFRMGGASMVASADANVSFAVGKKVKVGYAPSSAVRETSI